MLRQGEAGGSIKWSNKKNLRLREEDEELEAGHRWMRRGRGLTDFKAGYRISQVAEMVVVFRGIADTSC